MGQSRYLTMLFRLGVFSAIIFAWMHPACAASLSMEVALGFNDRFQINKWTPITVIIENRGKGVSGTLEVLATSGSEYHRNVYQAAYSIDLDLPYGSSKQCAFTVLIESFTHDLIVRYRQGEKALASESINLRTLYTQKELAGILIDGIYPEIIPAIPKSLSSVHLRERFLPEAWYGYEGVKLMIMEAVKMNRLTAPQLSALERWVWQGGFLVVTGSINSGVLLDRGVQRLLPLTVKGIEAFDQLRLLFDFIGQETDHPDPFLVLNVRIEDAEVLSMESGIPLIIDRKFGNGKIVFLSFDPHSQPFIRLMSHPGFWNKIITVAQQKDPDSIAMPVQRILQIMLASTNMRFPGYWLSGFTVCFYLILLWVYAKKLKSNKWKSLRYLLLTILCFSLTGVGYSLSSAQKNAMFNSFCRVNLIENRSYSDGEYVIGLYSTGEEPYTFSFKESAMPIRHVLLESANQKVPKPYRIQRAGRHDQIVGEFGKWSVSFYLTQPRFEIPFYAAMESGADRLNVTIDNQTPHEIVECKIYYNGNIFEIDDIAADSRETRSIKTSAIGRQQANDTEQSAPANISGVRMAPTFFDTMKGNLKEDLMSAILKTADEHADNKTVYITGWINADILKPNFTHQGITGKGVTLISWKGTI